MNRFEFKSSETPVRLSLRADETDPAGYLVAEVQDEGLRATTRVARYDPIDKPISEFFATMALEYRGWEGRMAWDSFEGELRLVSYCDKVGHVCTEVTLRQTPMPGWTIKVTLATETGLLGALAKQLKEFEASLPEAA